MIKCIVFGFIAILFIWTIIILADRAGKEPLTIAVVPSDARITVNGNQMNDGNHWVNEGTYTITAEKDGFEKQQQSLTVSKEKDQNVVALSLVPKSDEAKAWAKKHADKYKDNERYGARAAHTEGEYFTNQNPITKELPYTDPYYKIGYIVNEDRTITITILTQSPRYRFYAIEQIREWGYDPTNFVIDFKDFKNPLGAS